MVDVGGRPSKFREGDYVSWEPPARFDIEIPVGHPGVVQALADPPAVGVWWALPGGGFRSFHEVYDQDWLVPLAEHEFVAFIESVHGQPTVARFEGGGGGYVDTYDLPSD